MTTETAKGIQRISLGERWLSFRETGVGEPVLLLHSGGFTSRQWRKLIEMLSPSHRMIAPDLLGYGASSLWPNGEPFHFRQDLEAIEALLDTLGAPAHVVGHSYGALLGLQLALSRPAQVRSLALFEPVAFGILDEADDDEARGNLSQVEMRYEACADGADDAWLAQFVDWWNGTGAWNTLPPETKTAFRSVGWKVFQEVASLMADTTDRKTYGTITAPTLLLGGEQSPRAERRVLDKLTAALKNAKCRIFLGVGHMGPITHASLVNRAIAEHVRSVSGGI